VQHLFIPCLADLAGSYLEYPRSFLVHAITRTTPRSRRSVAHPYGILAQRDGAIRLVDPKGASMDGAGLFLRADGPRLAFAAVRRYAFHSHGAISCQAGLRMVCVSQTRCPAVSLGAGVSTVQGCLLNTVCRTAARPNPRRSDRQVGCGRRDYGQA